MEISKPYSLYKSGSIYLIIGNDFSRVEDYIEVLTQDLLKKHFKGDILFDLLLSNGNNSTRFFKAHFDGVQIATNSYKKVAAPELKIVKKTEAYFYKNKSLLNNSVLSSSEITRFLSAKEDIN